MLKGTMLFASGMACGYGLALKNQEPNGEVKAALSDFLRTMKHIFADAWLDSKLEAKARRESEKQEKETL